MVVAQGLGLSVAGLVAGLAAAFEVGRLLDGVLYGVAANDPATIGAVAGLLGIASLLAAYWPARQATASGLTDLLKEEL